MASSVSTPFLHMNGLPAEVAAPLAEDDGRFLAFLNEPLPPLEASTAGGLAVCLQRAAGRLCAANEACWSWLPRSHCTKAHKGAAELDEKLTLCWSCGGLDDVPTALFRPDWAVASAVGGSGLPVLR